MSRARNVHLLLTVGAISLLSACTNIDSRSAAVAPAPPQPVASAMVKQVQDRLQHDGYYRQGAIDGVWGAGTMTAVQAFQRDHSLSASGQLDMPTLQALNVADAGNGPAGSPASAATGPTASASPTSPNSAPNANTYNTAPATTPPGSTAAPR